MFVRPLLLASVFALAAASPAHALVLEWQNNTWNNGTSQNPNPPNSYETDSSRPGTDMTLSFSGFTGEFPNDPRTNVPTSPSVNQSLWGGQTAPQNSLVISPDFTRDTHGITLTIDFSAQYPQGVSNVSFSIFDIDASGGLYIDEVRSMSATLVGGAQVAATISGLGSSVTPSGTGLAQVLDGNSLSPDTGAGSGNGNATLSFNADGITRITLTFGDPTGQGAGNPTAQNFGVGNITYSPVPEMNPTIVAVSIALLGALAMKRRRALEVCFQRK